jgi:hypothetical protein
MKKLAVPVMLATKARDRERLEVFGVATRVELECGGATQGGYSSEQEIKAKRKWGWVGESGAVKNTVLGKKGQAGVSVVEEHLLVP